MQYERKGVFTLIRLMNQIVGFFNKNGDFPKVIFLPIHEYIFLNYLLPNNNFLNRKITFLGILIKPIKDDNIKKKFKI